MKTCRAMRHASLGALNRTAARPVQAMPRSRIEIPPAARITAPRGFSMLPLLRGLHDGIRKSMEVAQWLSKGPLAPGTASSRLSRPSPPNTPRSPVQQIHASRSSSSWQTSAPALPNAYPDSKVTLPEQLRATMRLLPHSVVVCTSSGDSAPRAMTMSSFTSLSLAPTPLVSFNVKTPSRTLEAIASSRQFNIHCLAGTPAGAALADHFTRGNLGDDVFGALGEGVKCETPEDGSPVLKGDAVLYVLRCRLMHEAPMHGLMRVRDHVIVAGEVLELLHGSGEREFGLAYGDRKYRQLGGVISNDG